MFRRPLGGSTRRRPGQAGACASGLWASATPQMRLRIGPRSLRIGPSGKQQPLGKARPGPNPARRAKTEKRCVPPSPPLSLKWGQGGRCSLPERCGSGKATEPGGKKSCGPPAKGNEGDARPRGGECHSGEPHARPRQAACGGPCVGISFVARTQTRVRGPCGRTPSAHHPPKERTAPHETPCNP